MGELPQSQGSTEGDKTLVKMKWKKLRLKALHVPEEGEADSFYKCLQGIWKLQVSALRVELVLMISQCLMGSAPTCKRIAIQGHERFKCLLGECRGGKDNDEKIIPFMVTSVWPAFYVRFV